MAFVNSLSMQSDVQQARKPWLPPISGLWLSLSLLIIFATSACGQEIITSGSIRREMSNPLHSQSVLDEKSISNLLRSLQEEEEEEEQSSFCQIPIQFDRFKGHKEVYTVGVLAIRGPASAYSEFNATFADYLTQTAGQRFEPPIRFELRPVELFTLYDDIQEVDFVYVNPSAYSCIESEYEANSLVSQVSRRRVGGNTYDLKKFGGVIATLKDRDDINTIMDLKDKIIATASISGLGSGQMQFKEMIDNGMNYLQDPKQLVFTSNQGLVVKGLLTKEFDVGFIRTDQIERSKDADGNPVNRSLFKVIDPKPDLAIDGEPFPFESSTELYAEWNVAALTKVSTEVSREVQKALLMLADYSKIGAAVDKCYQNTNETLSTEDGFCNQIPLSDLYDGPIPCSATHETVQAAFVAQKNGRYAGWTTSLSYLQLRSMQEATGFITKEEGTNKWRCVRSTELYDAITCPAGSFLKSREMVGNGCEELGLTCPESFKCICRPCEIPEPFECVNSIQIGDKCIKLGIFLPSVILPLLLIVGIIVHWYVEKKRKQADSVWIVENNELEYEDPPTIVGRGRFGLVLLAEYRGTQVAVKRVIPPSMTVDPMFDFSGKSNTVGGSDETQDCMEQGMLSVAGLNKLNPGMMSLAPGKLKELMKNPRIIEKIKSKQQAMNFKKSMFTTMIDEDTHKRMKQDFEAEIRQLARLRHPCITTVMGAVMPSKGGEPLLIMEYMRHGSLYDVLRDDSIILKPEQILEILQDVAQGLRFLHSANPQVVHGDLKAQNVLIDTNFCAKVTDFGLSGKRHNGAVGTPYWMSPELLSGESPNSTASDIYAYGMIIYEIYSGREPYDGEVYEEVIKNILDPRIRKRPQVPLHCPAKIAKLMINCLEHDPIERPTAEQLDLTLKVEMKVKERTSRLEALNKELEQANHKIASASAMQLQHFACMSHEIRTPLNCIIGLSSLLEETELNPMQRESMEMIVSSGKLLRQIVDDVLDYSKLESGNAEVLVKKVNLQETLNAVVHLIKTSRVTTEKELDVVTLYDPLLPEVVDTDSRRIQQILYNLLGNAIKFSCEKGRVEFGVKVVNKAVLSFTIKDYGKGIEEKDYGKIFEPFRQTETGLSNASGGTGLGLAITKKLVQAMGGNISVESAFGSWTQFTVDFSFQSKNIVNLDTLSSRLKNTTIFFVANENDPNTQRIEDTFNQFHVDFAHFNTMQDLAKAIATNDALLPDATYVCLAHESLYESETVETLLASCRACLVTYGPNFEVPRTRKHFRSLVETFPSVLIHRLGIFADEISRNPILSTKKEDVQDAESMFASLRILIAEDNIVNQKVLTRILNRLGVTEISIANNGLEAVKIEADSPFDLVLMDMQMPKLDGVEACAELQKRKGGHPQAKVIFVTAHVSDSFRQTCLDNGAIGYLPKPCSVDSVREVLQHAIGQGSLFSPVYRKSWNEQTSPAIFET